MKRNLIVIFGLTITVLFLSGCQRHNCESNNEKFTKTGIVKYTEWYGGTIGIFFDDGSQLGLSDSPNAEYTLLQMDELLISGVNYTFYYHKECVMSDGNTEWWYEGQVIDRIKVNYNGQ